MNLTRRSSLVFALTLAACVTDSGNAGEVFGDPTGGGNDPGDDGGNDGAGDDGGGDDGDDGTDGGGNDGGDDGSDSGGIKLDVGHGGDLGGDGGDEETGCEKVDLLFVIDDSASMWDEQDQLTDAFPSFMQTIDEELVQEKGIDYRVGVVSVEMAGSAMCIIGMCADGHRGRLQHQADRLDCNDEPAGRWIETGPVDEVAAQFRCIASMEGQDFREMPFEAARAALVDRAQDNEAYNAGFLRQDALLVLIFVTDEDDQSVMNVPETWEIIPGPGPNSPVPDYWDIFVQLKGDVKERVTAIAISGARDEDCMSGDDVLAAESPRVHTLLDLAFPNSYWTDICGNDYVQPLQEALDVIEASCDEFPAGRVSPLQLQEETVATGLSVVIYESRL